MLQDASYGFDAARENGMLAAFVLALVQRLTPSTPKMATFDTAVPTVDIEHFIVFLCLLAGRIS